MDADRFSLPKPTHCAKILLTERGGEWTQKTGPNAMHKEIGFDNQKYLETQSAHIRERIAQFGGKLYLEFGGKLFDDHHAARVLPGFAPDSKIRMLLELRDSVEIVVAINAAAIEQNKVRGDLGITYDEDVLRLIDTFRGEGLYVGSVAITQYAGQPAADAFKRRLEDLGVQVYLHYPISGYPHNVAHIVSDEGFGRNDYIQTTRPLVVVTAPGPGSGKMATCLSQLYHHHKRGIQAGYAKFETFPIWNLPLKHPVNLAYEAATADLKDVNMIDHFHLEAYGVTTVNYNRDLEAFPVVRTLLSKVMGGQNVYQSPTDMGVNMAGYGIFDDAVVREAAKQEIIRRYYRARTDYAKGRTDEETVQKIEMVMKSLDLSPEDRSVVRPALERAQETDCPVFAIEMPDGKVVTGRGAGIMNADASAVLNAVKYLAGINDDIYLLSNIVLEPIVAMKKDVQRIADPVLNLDEVLLALSICAATNTVAELAVAKLGELRNCQAHASYMLSQSNEVMLSRLGIQFTCEDAYPSSDLYYV